MGFVIYMVACPTIIIIFALIYDWHERRQARKDEETEEFEETEIIDNTVVDDKLICSETVLGQREMRFLGMTNETVSYLLTRAETDNKSPAQIIDDLVSKEIAATYSHP